MGFAGIVCCCRLVDFYSSSVAGPEDPCNRCHCWWFWRMSTVLTCDDVALEVPISDESTFQIHLKCCGVDLGQSVRHDVGLSQSVLWVLLHADPIRQRRTQGVDEQKIYRLSPLFWANWFLGFFAGSLAYCLLLRRFLQYNRGNWFEGYLISSLGQKNVQIVLLSCRDVTL